jgi:hypothetical protein
MLLRAGAAAAALVLAVIAAAPAVAQVPAPSGVLVIEVSGVSLEGLLSIPEVRTIASYGGAALLSHPDQLAQQANSIQRAMTTRVGPPQWQLVDLGYLGEACPVGMAACSGGGPVQVGLKIADILRGYDDQTITVVVASVGPSPTMEAQKDLLTGLVMGRLVASQAVPYATIANPPPLTEIHSLTSASTRRGGVVAGSDLAATVGSLIGLTTAHGLPSGGAPIRVVDEAAPLALHQRYLAQRRMYVPIGIAAGIYVTVIGLGCSFVVAFRRGGAPGGGGGPPPPAVRRFRWHRAYAALNPRVRGSSPWRRTGNDLQF